MNSFYRKHQQKLLFLVVGGFNTLFGLASYPLYYYILQNNTVRVIQRKAYGFRDERYLAMKIITHFLPALPDHAKITHKFPR